MGSSRKISPTPPKNAQPVPDIQTPGWCRYNPDDDSGDEVSLELSPFDTSESNYVRLHQERADYERSRWQKFEIPVSTPRRKTSKSPKPVFPTPQECAYYLHAALANIAGSRKPKAPRRKQISSEYKAIIGALSGVEEMLNSQIQHLSQHLANDNPNPAKGKSYPLRPSLEGEHSAPYSPTVESGLSFLFHITATFAALARPMLTELTNAAKQLDAEFKPNAPNLTFAALNKHFNLEEADKSSSGRVSKRLGNRCTSANGTCSSSGPTVSELAAEIRRLIPEKYTFLKANFTLNPNYRLEGTARSLEEMAATCEHPERFRPRTPPPSPPIEIAKCPRASRTSVKPPTAKGSRMSKRTRSVPISANGQLNRHPSSAQRSDRCPSKPPHTKRRKQEPVLVTPPHTPLTSRPPSQSYRTSPIASDLPVSRRRASNSASLSGYMQGGPSSGMAGPSYGTPSPPNNRRSSAMKHASFAPVVFRLPSDARQKLRENVKRRLPHVRTEEDENEMRAYAIEEDGEEDSVDSRSSRSKSVPNSPLTVDVQHDTEDSKVRQRIKFHQVVDVDEPEVVEQPIVVDLDA